MLEDVMLAEEITIPVYFLLWSKELEKILVELSDNAITDNKMNSATEALFSSVAANGYQIVINPRNPNAKSDIKIATLQGNLAGHAVDGKTATIAIVAHYDSFGIAPVTILLININIYFRTYTILGIIFWC